MKSNKVIIEEKPSPNYHDKPVPPRPVLQHLAVAVTTYALSDYSEILPDRIDKCFIQRYVWKLDFQLICFFL